MKHDRLTCPICDAYRDAESAEVYAHRAYEEGEDDVPASWWQVWVAIAATGVILWCFLAGAIWTVQTVLEELR
jgi:hypothetical protein